MINLENFTLTVMALDALKLLGYKEVWIGKCECPHWDWPMTGDIVASPKIRNPFPAMWNVSERIFGKMGCGNGLKEADQMQRSFNNLISGYYKLVGENWETSIFEKEESNV